MHLYVANEHEKKIDTFLSQIMHHTTSADYTPINANEQLKEFLKTKKNPLFLYKKNNKLENVKTLLSQLSIPQTFIGNIILKRKEEIINKIQLHTHVATDDFAMYSAKVYPLPDQTLVKQAQKILTLNRTPPVISLPRKKALELIQNAFAELQLNWKIENASIVSGALVNNLHQTLKLKKSERFSQNTIYRLIVHEIGTHIIRFENGKLQPLQMFQSGFANYLETEEGLAVYNELLAGVMSPSILRNYAGRVLAIHYASQNDFATTYKYLCKNFRPSTALKLTLRAKRGMSDTSQPGAFTKDVCYLRGFIKILQFAKNHNVEKLYVGKVGIEDIPLIDQLATIVPVRITPYTLIEKMKQHTALRAITLEQIQSLLSQTDIEQFGK